MKFLDNNKIQEMLHFRHSCKVFNDNKMISKEDLDTIIESGYLSPSSSGLEHTRILVIEKNSLLRKKIEERAQMWGAKKQLPTSSHFIIYLAKTKKMVGPGNEETLKQWNEGRKFPKELIEGYKEVYKTWHTNFNLETEEQVQAWSHRQAYIVMANMLTTAALLGIDSCPIEGFTVKNLEDLLEEEGLLNKQDYRVSVTAAFGYRIKEQSKKERNLINKFVKYVK